MKSNRLGLLITILLLLGCGAFIFITLQAKTALQAQLQQKLQEISSKEEEIQQSQLAMAQLTKEKAETEKKLQADLAFLQEAADNSKKTIDSLNGRVAELIKNRDSLLKKSEDTEAILLKLKKKITELEKEKSGLKTQMDERAKSLDENGAPVGTFVDELNDISDITSQAVLPSPINLGKIVVQKMTQRAAKVEHINSLYGFIVIGAGSDDGLKNNMLVNVTRDDRFVARAVIKQLRGDHSTATLIPEWLRDEIKIGDIVRVE